MSLLVQHSEKFIYTNFDIIHVSFLERFLKILVLDHWLYFQLGYSFLKHHIGLVLKKKLEDNRSCKSPGISMSYIKDHKAMLCTKFQAPQPICSKADFFYVFLWFKARTPWGGAI